jgi:hypothetical protein
MSKKRHGGMILIGENPKNLRKTCPNATLSTTNSTWTDLVLCDERPMTNSLSHGMAQ